MATGHAMMINVHLDRGQKHVYINIWIKNCIASAHYEFGKDIVYEFINFISYLRNHEEFMSFASNQISRLSNMSNPIQVKNENADYIWLANMHWLACTMEID